MPVRSQRHLQEIQGIDSAGEGSQDLFSSAALDMNWLTAEYNGAKVSDFTFTRTSGAYASDIAGNYTQYASGVMRLDARGRRHEDARANAIRNNVAGGATIGSPGVSPTNWFIGVPNGTTRQIIGTATEKGVACLDVRVSGTCTGTGALAIRPEAIGIMLANNSEAWTASVFARMVADVGATPLSDLRMSILAMDSVPGQIAANDGPNLRSLLNGPLTRFSTTLTTPSSNTISVLHQVTSGAHAFTAGQVVDFTVRIGWPQCEKGVFESSPIPTATVSVTRTAESMVLAGTKFNNIYPPAGDADEKRGTLFWQGSMLGINTPNNQFLIGPNNAGNTNEIYLYVNGSGAVVGRANVANSDQFSIGSANGIVLPRTRFKAALAYQPGQQRLAVNGTIVASATAGNLPARPTLTQLNLGGRGEGSFKSYAFEERASYFQYFMSSYELTEITKL